MAVAFNAQELSTTWIDGARRRRLLVLSAAGVLLSLGMVRLVLAMDIIAAALVLIALALAAIVLQPRYGLYLLFAVVLFFEMSYDPIMAPGYYLDNSLQTTLKISGAILEPLELIELLIAAVWLAHSAMRQRFRIQGGSLGLPVFLFTLALVYGSIRGLLAGANFNFIFWESRYLFGMTLVYLLTTNLIRNRQQLKTLITFILIFTSLSGIEAVYRKFALIDTGALLNQTGVAASQENWYSHETPVFWGLLVMLVLGQQAFGGPRWQKMYGTLAMVGTALAFLVSERRAGIVAIMIAFIAFSLVLVVTRRKAFCLLSLPIIVAGVVYLPLFWNNTGTIGQGARAVRSISSPDPRDAASNAWRDIEAINVRATIMSSPIAGIGFGMPFLQVVPEPNISFFAFWNLEAHHGILWVWMKSGGVGFSLFFVMLTAGIARSAFLIKTMHDATSRTVALLAMSAIIMSAVFCYVDLGLTGSRVPILLGVMLGAVSVLDRLPDRAPTT